MSRFSCCQCAARLRLPLAHWLPHLCRKHPAGSKELNGIVDTSLEGCYMLFDSTFSFTCAPILLDRHVRTDIWLHLFPWIYCVAYLPWSMSGKPDRCRVPVLRTVGSLQVAAELSWPRYYCSSAAAHDCRGASRLDLGLNSPPKNSRPF